jgi:tRNA pseudouridine38-40 synthase
MRLAAGIEYCGTEFEGWQRQSGGRTVQECVEKALSTIASHALEVHCAGRTDSGVHAVQQVIHFETNARRENYSWVFGANSNLPSDVSVNWIIPVEDDFHARFSALSRHYRYYILNRESRPSVFKDYMTWQIERLDESMMAQAAECLVGEHDFTSYRAVACQSKSPVRNIIRLDISRQKDLVIIDVEANAFLHHMVRNIAGVLIMIGSGDKPVNWARDVLDAKDRTLGGVTAPANGLFLMNVKYNEKFDIPTHASFNSPIMRMMETIL